MKFHIIATDAQTERVVHNVHAETTGDAVQLMNALRIQEDDAARAIQTSDEILALLRGDGYPTTTVPPTTKETTMLKTKFKITGKIIEDFEIVLAAYDEKEARNVLSELTSAGIRAHRSYDEQNVEVTVTKVAPEKRDFNVEGTIEVPFSIVVSAEDAEAAMDAVRELSLHDIRRDGELQTEEVTPSSAEPTE